MCGFVVAVTAAMSSRNVVSSLSAGLEAILHRGPDSSGSYFEDLRSGDKLAMGHVRLSIIDTSPTGSQPMHSSCGRYVIVYNGELYNYKELSGLLPNHEFVSKSDTEIFLELYASFGAEIFKKMSGMFAAVIFDRLLQKLIVVRDHIGIKPIYLYNDGSTIVLSSEIRGLLPFVHTKMSVDRDALFEFLNCGFCYEPKTGFHEVTKVLPGHFATVVGFKVEYEKYFDLRADDTEKFLDAPSVEDAVRNQLVADVKVGNLFSGGVDSSVIAAIANVDNLFLEYDEERPDQHNDGYFAREIAMELRQKLSIVKMKTEERSSSEIFDLMFATAEGVEELISDFTYISSLKISEHARLSGFKVMLSGMGGDEVFVGYPRYTFLGSPILHALGFIFRCKFIVRIGTKVPIFAKKLQRLHGYYCEKEFPLKYARLLGYLSQSELQACLGMDEYFFLAKQFVERQHTILQELSSANACVKATYLDFYGFLSHNLIVADKSSMRNGIEFRVPLLDRGLYSYCFSKIRGGEVGALIGKKPLKDFLSRFIRRDLIFRRKTGFNAPLDGMILKLGEDGIFEELSTGFIFNYLDRAAVAEIICNHFSKKENNTYKIWQFLFFHFWLKSHRALIVS